MTRGASNLNISSLLDLFPPVKPLVKKDLRECEYCGRPNNTRDTCFKLYSRPPRG